MSPFNHNFLTSNEGKNSHKNERQRILLWKAHFKKQKTKNKNKTKNKRIHLLDLPDLEGELQTCVRIHLQFVKFDVNDAENRWKFRRNKKCLQSHVIQSVTEKQADMRIFRLLCDFRLFCCPNLCCFIYLFSAHFWAFLSISQTFSWKYIVMPEQGRHNIAACSSCF